jgi:hypothetical protein
LSFANLTPLRALIRAEIIFLTPVDFPFTDKSTWRAFRDNSSTGSLKKSPGHNPDLKVEQKLW